MKNIEGKVALISGTIRGQGAAEARIFVERGAKIMVCDVLDAEGEQTAADIGDSAAYIHLDVTSESDRPITPVSLISASITMQGYLDQAIRIAANGGEPTN